MSSVSDVMNSDVRSVGVGDPASRARSLILDDHVGAVPVLDDASDVVGVVTATDLLAHPDADLDVGTVMSSGVVTVRVDATVAQAARTMSEHGAHHLVVTDATRLVGVVSAADLVRALVGSSEPTGRGEGVGAEQPADGAARSHVHAAVGDRIVIRGHAVGGKDRRGIITAVRGADGGPPFSVEWLDDPHAEPHEVLFFPGTDADVEHPVEST